MFYRILYLLFTINLTLTSTYASDIDQSSKSNQLASQKIISPISLQAIEQNSYLLFEQISTPNDMMILYKTNDALKTKRYFLAKQLNGKGILKDTKNINNIDLFNVTKIYQIKKSNYIAVGYEQDFSKRSGHQATILLFDNTGKTKWKTVVGKNKSYAEAMIMTNNNEYVVVGHDWVGESKDKSRGNYHVMAAKVDGKGNRLWTKHFSIDGSYAKGLNIEKTKDEGFVIVGESTDNSRSNKAWIFKIDSNGNKVWEIFYDEPSTPDTAFCISDNNKDGYIVAGMSRVSGLSNDQSWIMKINYSGKKEWDVPLAIKEPFLLQSIKQIGTNYMISGFYTDILKSSLFFLEVDINGNKQFEKIIEITN